MAGEAQRILTPRLTLREFRDDDFGALLAYQSDPRYLRYYDFDTRTEADVRGFLAMLMGWARERPRAKYQLAVELDGKLIGCCGVRKASADSREAEFGCELDPEYWGKGYALEASRAILDYAYGHLGVRRVIAHTVEENGAAIALAKRLGMRVVRAGTLAADLPLGVPPPEV